MPDTACASGTGYPGRLLLVSQPATREDSDAACRAPQSLAGPLQLLWGQWQPQEFGLSAVPCPSGVVQMAEPSQPADAMDVGEVPGPCAGFSSSESPDHGAYLGMSDRETCSRWSRMVEISMSGSGRASAG